MIDGRPSLRTVAGDLEQARVERELLREAARNGLLTLWPRLTFGAVACHWLARFERQVATGERRERTLENYRYHLDRHLLPELGRKRIRSLTPADMASLVAALTAKGLAPKTVANALVPLGGIVRFARRRGYILDDPLRRLEKAERPRPTPRAQRVLGQSEIAELLRACLPRYRPLLATALYTGMRLSELLALTWAEVDFEAGVVRVRAQLSRAHLGAPARRVAPKTRAAVRDIPLAPQLATVLAGERAHARFRGDDAYVFATRVGTPLGQRNVARTALAHAVTRAGLDHRGQPQLRFHDLRHTFASHLIVDLRLDVCQVSRILGHARTAITLDVYTHLFDRARHAADVRTAMADSRFAQILAEATAPEPSLATEAALARPMDHHPLDDGNARSSVAAPVANQVNADALDHSLTNVLCPGRSDSPVGIALISSVFDGASRTRTGDLLGAIGQTFAPGGARPLKLPVCRDSLGLGRTRPIPSEP
jgi:integrase